MLPMKLCYISKLMTVYCIEMLLSFDNIIVLVYLFRYLKISYQDQNAMVLLGIPVSCFMRGIILILGTGFISNFVTKVKYVVLLADILVILSMRYLYLCNTETLHIYHKRAKSNNCFKFLYSFFLMEKLDLIFALDSLPVSMLITSNPCIVLLGNILSITCFRLLFLFVSHVAEKISCFNNIVVMFTSLYSLNSLLRYIVML